MRFYYLNFIFFVALLLRMTYWCHPEHSEGYKLTVVFYILRRFAPQNDILLSSWAEGEGYKLTVVFYILRRFAPQCDILLSSWAEGEGYKLTVVFYILRRFAPQNDILLSSWAEGEGYNYILRSILLHSEWQRKCHPEFMQLCCT